MCNRGKKNDFIFVMFGQKLEATEGIKNYGNELNIKRIKTSLLEVKTNNKNNYTHKKKNRLSENDFDCLRNNYVYQRGEKSSHIHYVWPEIRDNKGYQKLWKQIKY